MRRPTLYKHRGKWYARFWNEQEGKYHSKSLNVPVEGKKERRREAEDAARKIADSLTAVPQILPENNPASMPLLDYVTAFWQPDSEYAREKALVEKKPISKHYLVTNQRTVETKMKPFPGFTDLTLGGLSKPLIRQWKIWLAEQGYSGRVINTAMQALKVPVRRAFGDDMIPTDPFAGVPLAAHRERARGILTPAEIRRLVETPVANPHSRLAVYLSLYCSMRMGEVRGLLWGDIADGVIHIRHNWQEGEGLKPCKCGSEGLVPMPRLVAELVSEVYKTAPLTGLGDFVMSQRPYRPACREILWQSLRYELASIGITEEQRKERNIVYHSLRHSFATTCKLIGLNDFESMALSRHKDIKAHRRYIDHPEALDLHQIGERFERYFLPEAETSCAMAREEA